MKYTLYTILFSVVILFTATGVYGQCPTSSMSVYNITDDSATISYATVSGVSNLEYAVLPATVTTPTTGTSTTAGLILRIGLTIGTAYKAWLRSDCGGGVYTPWVALSFSTPCGSPGTINIDKVAGDYVDLSWTSVSPSASYEYFVDTASTTPTGSGTLVSTNKATQNGLMPAKTYYAFVRTKCPSSYSAWSAGKSFFSAFPTHVSSFNAANAIVIYPNPVKDKLYITDLPANASVTIINAIGTTLYQTQVNGAAHTVDMQQYPTGIYILKYSNGQYSNAVRIEKL